MQSIESRLRGQTLAHAPSHKYTVLDELLDELHGQINTCRYIREAIDTPLLPPPTRRERAQLLAMLREEAAEVLLAAARIARSCN